jgi:hypothetical protein
MSSSSQNRSRDPDEEYLDPFDEDLGVYVGEATRAEVVEAIAAHTVPGATFVARLSSPAGETYWQKPVGALTEHINGCTDITLADLADQDGEDDVEDDDQRAVFVDDAPRTDVFVFGGEDSAYFPAWTVFREVPLVLDLSADDRSLYFERFSGGVRLTFTGAGLTLVFWHTIEHVTEEGDIAPGFPQFRGRVEEVQEGDEPDGEPLPPIPEEDER